MGVRPISRPEPLEPTLMPVVLAVVMMEAEVAGVVRPAVPVTPAPPTVCVMIFAAVPECIEVEMRERGVCIISVINSIK